MDKFRETNIYKNIVLCIADVEQVININAFIKNIDLSENYERCLTPTEMGKMITPKLSAIKVNQLLGRHGYQYKDSRGNWIPTEKAINLIKFTSAVTLKKDEMFIIDLTIRWRQDTVSIIGKLLQEEKQED